MDRWWPRFLSEYSEALEPRYGRLRPAVRRSGGEYLRCGILDFGFARIRCDECGAEHLLAFSCKSRICPSCMKKRQLLFGEFLAGSILERVSHRHVVFSIPRRLRPFFHHHRALLAGLSRSAWESLQEALRHELGEPSGRGAAVQVVHTWGDLLDWHPHVHGLVAWGLFGTDGAYRGAPPLPAGPVHDIFRLKVFGLLRRAGLVDAGLVEDMLSWPHSGFHVWLGPLVSCLEADALEQMSQYTARGPVSLERLSVVPGGEPSGSRLSWEEGGADDRGRVVCTAGKAIAKHGGDTRVFDPLQFIAELTMHVPDTHQKMALYYGWYSNRSRGERRKRAVAAGLMPAAAPEPAPPATEAPRLSKANWARFIKKVYEADPLLCPRCSREMRIVAFIQEAPVVFRILLHLGLLGLDASAPAERGPPGR
jgi:hypothetical protein